MNENLDLVSILKDCPKGTKLYSLIYGDVELEKISNDENDKYPIFIRLHANTIYCVAKDGRHIGNYDGECVLFPSKDQRDWSKFKPKKPKFDPKTLKHFDKVLTRDNNLERWRVQLFSNIIEGDVDYPYLCINNPYRYCIPYNEETKHLVGTAEEAPEYYRYWED